MTNCREGPLFCLLSVSSSRRRNFTRSVFFHWNLQMVWCYSAASDVLTNRLSGKIFPVMYTVKLNHLFVDIHCLKCVQFAMRHHEKVTCLCRCMNAILDWSKTDVVVPYAELSNEVLCQWSSYADLNQKYLLSFTGWHLLCVALLEVFLCEGSN